MPAITIDEFIEKLRETPRTWFLNGDSIRIYRQPIGRCCPLTAISGNYRMTDHRFAAKYLGLSEKDGEDIASCADFKIMPTDTEDNQRYRELRRRLIDACGLVE